MFTKVQTSVSNYFKNFQPTKDQDKTTYIAHNTLAVIPPARPKIQWSRFLSYGSGLGFLSYYSYQTFSIFSRVWADTKPARPIPGISSFSPIKVEPQTVEFISPLPQPVETPTPLKIAPQIPETALPPSMPQQQTTAQERQKAAAISFVSKQTGLPPGLFRN